MDPFDKSQTDKVWQRVLNRPANPAPAAKAETPAGDVDQLQPIIEQARAGAVCYLALTRRTGGRGGAILRRLYEEKQNQVDCLAGLYFLLRGKRPAPSAAKPPAQEPLEATLRRCYGGEMRLLAALETTAALPEYGPVCKKLALQTQEHCRLILELLGRNGRM